LDLLWVLAEEFGCEALEALREVVGAHFLEFVSEQDNAFFG